MSALRDLVADVRHIAREVRAALLGALDDCRRLRHSTPLTETEVNVLISGGMADAVEEWHRDPRTVTARTRRERDWSRDAERRVQERVADLERAVPGFGRVRDATPLADVALLDWLSWERPALGGFTGLAWLNSGEDVDDLVRLLRYERGIEDDE